MLHVHLKREEVMYVVEHIYSWAKERGEIPQHPAKCGVAWHCYVASARALEGIVRS